MASAASATTLSFRHIFGVNTNVNDNISFTDEDTIVYVAGHSLVLYSLVDKRQRFIHSSEITESITAYTSGSGKRLVAIAERSEHPSFHVFDLRTFRRKKTIVATEVISKEIISLQFSEDNALLLALSGHPDWTLMCWNWAKSKLIASTSVSFGSPVYKCMFSPLDASVAAVIGKECVKFFRVGEKEIRPLQENIFHNTNFTAFCWMRNPDDHLLVGTDEGKIIVFRSGEVLLHLPCSPGSEFPITSLISIAGGFIAGSAPGAFLFFRYDDSKDQAYFDTQFTLIKILTASDLSNGYIISLALDPRDEKICGLTSDGQLLSVSAIPENINAKSTNNGLNNGISNMGQNKTITNSSMNQHPSTNSSSIATLTVNNGHSHIQINNNNNNDIKYTMCSFHNPKHITGMDICIRKPLIITCSKDQTLRIWNFKNHTLELLKHYPEDMFSCALHPSGLQCAIGFTDKVRAYHILMDDLRICFEVSIKACRDCCFSSGGHVLAATNGNSILVYDFITGEKIADLRGHNSKVRSIRWLPSGFQLLSAGQDGAVYIWSLDGMKRVAEFVQKGTMYTSAVFSNNTVLVVGNDRTLRELTLPDLLPNKLSETGLVLTNIELSVTKLSLFASTFEYAKPGYVRAYPYPVTGDYDDYPCTNSQITRMRMTPDENFLIVTDEQGCIVLIELKGRQDRYQRTNPSSYIDLYESSEWSEEVMVTRVELEDLKIAVSELQTKVEELINQNDYQLKLKDMNYSEKIKETTDKFITELEASKNKLEMLQEVRFDYEIESIEKIKYMEEMHQNNIQSMETNFQAQIMEMVDKYQQLVKDRDAQIERLDEQRRMLVRSHEKYADELTIDFDSRLDDDKQARLTREVERDELEKELLESQNQLEDDIDTEIENMKKQYEEKLAVSRETTLKYKGDNGLKKKQFHLMLTQQDEQKEEMKLLQAKEKELHDAIKLLEKEVSAHKKEIKTRDISIGEKEKRIYELKKKNQELDKFKFVLDFKIRELKQQIEPRQLEIMAMREKIKNMDNELEKYHKTNSNLDVLIGDLRVKIDLLQTESKEKRMAAKQQETIIATFRRDVHGAISHIQSPELLIPVVEKIVKIYGSMDNIKPRIDPDVEGEYARHKAFLLKSVQELKREVTKASAAHLEISTQLMKKNMGLIDEINDQREQNKQTKALVQAEIGRLRHLAQSDKPPKGGMLTSAKNKKNGKGVSGGGGSIKDSSIMSLPVLYAGESSVVDGFAPKQGGFLKNDDNMANAMSDYVEPSELLEKNRRRILALRAAIAELEGRSMNMMMKGYSRETLPPMDGGMNNIKDNSANYQDKNNSKSNNAGRKSVGLSLPPVTKEDPTMGGDSIISDYQNGNDNGPNPSTVYTTNLPEEYN
eukprot:gene4822-6757_t